MPVVNPYGGYLDQGGSQGAGANPYGSYLGQGMDYSSTPQGAGANPYGGFIQALQRQRQGTQQQTIADAMTQLRKMIAGMPTAPQQQGYLPPPIATDDVYAPSDYEKGVSGIESSGNYGAVNPASGAGGKYQFIAPTWDALAKQGLPLTPEGRTSDTPEGRQQQETAFKALTQQNAQALKKELGRAPTHAELYAAHAVGPGYASAILRNPNTPIEALVPDSFIKANPYMKGLDGATWLQLIGRKFNP